MPPFYFLREREALLAATEKSLQAIKARVDAGKLKGADAIGLRVGKVVNQYKVANVERAFRSLKTVDLKVRPIHHRTAGRVRAHILLCMLAYYVEYAAAKTQQRRIREFRYAADSWGQERRIATRLEFGAQGANPRFIVSNLDGPAAELYDGLYCQRGGESVPNSPSCSFLGQHSRAHLVLTRLACTRLRSVGPVKYPG